MLIFGDKKKRRQRRKKPGVVNGGGGAKLAAQLPESGAVQRGLKLETRHRLHHPRLAERVLRTGPSRGPSHPHPSPPVELPMSLIAPVEKVALKRKATSQ